MIGAKVITRGTTTHRFQQQHASTPESLNKNKGAVCDSDAPSFVSLLIPDSTQRGRARAYHHPGAGPRSAADRQRQS